MTLARFSNNYMPSVFDRLFDNNWMDWSDSDLSRKASMPAVNVKETENSYHLDVAAPGFKKEDLQLYFENGVLSVSGECKKEVTQNDEKFTRCEFNYSSFKRSFNISEKVIDIDKIPASYEAGILHVELPKREEIKPKPARTISIK